MTLAMSPPPNKKRKKTPSRNLSSPQSTPIPSIPDDILLSILARMSRLYYPTLSLVSNSFRSLLVSPELYELRSLLNRKERCLYVCLKLSPSSNPRWFTLCQKPNRILTNNTKPKKKPSGGGYALASIPIRHSPPAYWANLIAIGSEIYNIGGSTYKEPTSTVSVLDCRSHTWREAPCMHVERCYPMANYFDGKIYVAGGGGGCDASNWMESFDIKTQTWELVSSPVADRCGRMIGKSAVIGGDIYMFGHHNGVVYNPKEGDKWEVIAQMNSLDIGWFWFTYCVIDNVLYCYFHSDGIKLYDSMLGCWVKLNGLQGLPKFASYGCVKMVDYGGKMAVFWDKYLPCSEYKDKMIWCAVITIEKRIDGKLWGQVESLDPLLTVPKTYDFACACVVVV